MSTLTQPTSPEQVVNGNASLIQVGGAGTDFDVLTATGDVLVLSVSFHVVVAAIGLTSIIFKTNNTSSITLLASTLLAALTADNNLGAYVTPFVLPSGKKIRFTVVGTGTAGNVQVATRFLPLVAGAYLS